jgi:RNA polymerase sigma-70 factor, ECF subfamily
MTDDPSRIYEHLLILRCQTGDEDAFKEIIERYAPRLRAYLCRMLEASDVDDVLQEVWLALFRGISRLRDYDAFPAWIYRLARTRTSLQRRTNVTAYSLKDQELIDPNEDQEGFLAENVETIHLALGKLSADHREVLMLRFLEDMTYEQIASVIGCQVGTIRSRLHYAKHALRRNIERLNDDLREEIR